MLNGRPGRDEPGAFSRPAAFPVRKLRGGPCAGKRPIGRRDDGSGWSGHNLWGWNTGLTPFIL